MPPTCDQSDRRRAKMDLVNSLERTAPRILLFLAGRIRAFEPLIKLTSTILNGGWARNDVLDTGTSIRTPFDGILEVSY
jgi:hypothetical protein